jgi:hypothetical protein
MYLFIVFCYPHHYKTFATSNTIGGHLGKGKNVYSISTSLAHTYVSYYSMKRDSLTKFASCVNNIFHSALIISFVGDDFDSKLIFPVVTVLRKYTFRLNIYKNLKFEAILIPTLHRNDLIKPLSF